MKRSSIKLWITNAFFIILILAMLLSAMANLRQAYVNTMQQDAQLMTLCAQNVQNLLNHQWSLDELRQSPDGALYLQAREVLQEVCRAYQLEYLYIYSIDPVAPSRYYYLCVSPDAGKDMAAVRSEKTA